MKRLAKLSGAALLLALAAPSPAFAAATSLPVPVLSTTCTDGYLDSNSVDAARSADGKVHGFANFSYSAACGNKITYFEGSGTSWTVKPTSLVGKVVDVAADNTGSYLLYIIREVGVDEIAVVKRANNGTVTRHVMGSLAGSWPDGRGSIVAKDGTWYAVWPRFNGTRSVLHQARTMFGGDGTATTVPVSVPSTPTASDTFPALTLGPDGQPRLFWQRAVPNAKQDLLLSTGASGTWGTATRVAPAVTIQSLHPSLDIAVTGRRIFTSWTERTEAGDFARIAQSATGSSWSTTTPPYEYANWDAHIVASATTVFAAYTEGDEPPGGAWMATKDGSNPWVGSFAGGGIPHSIDTAGVAALVYHGSGISTALIFSNHELYAVTR
ncbi:MAG TPA: hypothetical protein VK453_11305 [Micromonosporaceae bacterium]|nr:hypothetical protein [Micromonosporaceae bacterium]